MAIACKCLKPQSIPKQAIFCCSKSWCNKAFTNKFYRFHHEKSCTKKVNRTKTSHIRKKKLSMTTNLTRHMLIHKKESMYECNTCKKSFLGKEKFDVHVSDCEKVISVSSAIICGDDALVSVIKDENSFDKAPMTDHGLLSDRKEGSNSNDSTKSVDHENPAPSVLNEGSTLSDNAPFISHLPDLPDIDSLPETEMSHDAAFAENNSETLKLTDQSKILSKTCHICNKTFTRRTNLQRHLLIHTNKRNCKSGDYSLKFGTGDLSSSTLTQSGDEIISTCASSENNSHDTLASNSMVYNGLSSYGNLPSMAIGDFPELNQHESGNSVHVALPDDNLPSGNHFAKKPFNDMLTQNSLKNSSSPVMNSHTRSEDDSKKCSICNKTFTRKTNLRRHLMIHRNRPVNESNKLLSTSMATNLLNNSVPCTSSNNAHAGLLPPIISSQTSEFNRVSDSADSSLTIFSSAECYTSRNISSYSTIYSSISPSHVDSDFHVTSSSSNIDDHAKNEVKNCFMCKKTFTCRKDLRKHLMIHFNQQKYEFNGMRRIDETVLIKPEYESQDILNDKTLHTLVDERYTSDVNADIVDSNSIDASDESRSFIDVRGNNNPSNMPVSHSKELASPDINASLCTDTYSCNSLNDYKISENIKSSIQMKDYKYKYSELQKTWNKDLRGCMTIYSQIKDRKYNENQQNNHIEKITDQISGTIYRPLSNSSESTTVSPVKPLYNERMIDDKPSTDDHDSASSLHLKSGATNSSHYSTLDNSSYDTPYEKHVENPKLLKTVPIDNDSESIPVVLPSDYGHLQPPVCETDFIRNFGKLSSNDDSSSSGFLIPSSSISGEHIVNGHKDPNGEVDILLRNNNLAKKKLKMCYICKKTFTRNTNLRKHLMSGKCRPEYNYRNLESYDKLPNTSYSEFMVDENTINNLNCVSNTESKSSMISSYICHDGRSLSSIDENTPIVIPSDCIEVPTSKKEVYVDQLDTVDKKLASIAINTCSQVSNVSVSEPSINIDGMSTSNSTTVHYSDDVKTEVCRSSGDSMIIPVIEKSEEACKKCNICNKTFSRAYNLRRHLITHMQGYIFNRYKNCLSKDEIGVQHENRKTIVSETSANIHGISNQSSFYIGKYNGNSQVRYVPNSFHNNRAMKTLDKYKNNIARRTCNICSKVFTRTTTLRRHMNIHKKLNYKCGICQKGFQAKEKFDVHVSMCAPVSQPIDNAPGYGNDLPTVSTDDINLSAFDLPLEGVEDAPVSHDIKTTISSDVKAFLSTSVEESGFPSHAIDQNLSQDSSMKTHMSKVKLDSRTCHLCNKTFTRTTTLRRHMQIHRKPSYKCERCQVCFNNKNIFTRHLAKCGHMINPSVQNAIDYESMKQLTVTVESKPSSGVSQLNYDVSLKGNGDIATSHGNTSNNQFDSKYLSEVVDPKIIEAKCLSSNGIDNPLIKQSYANSLPNLEPEYISMPRDDILIVQPSDHEHMQSYDSTLSPSCNDNSIVKPSYPENAQTVGVIDELKPTDSSRISFNFDDVSVSLNERSTKNQSFKQEMIPRFEVDVSLPQSKPLYRENPQPSMVSNPLSSHCGISMEKLPDQKNLAFCLEGASLPSDMKLLNRSDPNLYQPEPSNTNDTYSSPGTGNDIKSFEVKWKQKAARTCYICKKTFTRTTTLRRHMNIHNKKTNYKCSKCQMCFPRQDALAAHQSNCCSYETIATASTSEVDYINVNSDESIISQSNIENVISSEASFSISNTVSSPNSTGANLIYSDSKRNSQILSMTPIIESSSPPIDVIRNDRVTKISNKTCSICNKTFTRTTTLRRHLFIHKDKPPHKCEKCKNVFHGKLMFDRHKFKCSADFPMEDRYEFGNDATTSLNDDNLLYDDVSITSDLHSNLSSPTSSYSNLSPPGNDGIKPLNISLKTMFPRKRFSS